MNPSQKEIIVLLLKEGHYTRTRMNNNGDCIYVVYCGKQIPVKAFTKKVGDSIKQYLKKDRKNNYTLNLNLVRMEDGRTFIKRAYKSK